MPIRPKRDIFVFGPRFMIVCPRCEQRADLEKHDNPAKITLVCPSCDYARQWQGSQLSLASSWRWLGNMGYSVKAGFGGDAVDLWIETSSDATQQSQGLALRLWLQTPCQGENLWFLNDEHLVFARNYLDYSVENHPIYFSWEVRENMAKYHERVQWIEPWMKRAENRDAIIESVRKLRRERGTPF